VLQTEACSSLQHEHYSKPATHMATF